MDAAQALLEQGQLDAAMAKLKESPSDPESLALQGRVWAKRAEAAPPPTPPPPPSPMPRGYKPPLPPEFKPEELEALSAYQQAIAAKPDLLQAHQGLAHLLEPHAIRAFDQEQAAAAAADAAAQAASKGKRPSPSPSPSPTPAGPDCGPERVAREYQAAAQGTPPSKESLEEVIRFAVRVKQFRAAEWALDQTVAMDRMNPQPLVRYGDILLNEKKDVEGAIDRYQQALILKPDDDATRDRMADIYINMGSDLFDKHLYSVAEIKLKLAQPYITDRSSARARKLQQFLARLDEIRGH